MEAKTGDLAERMELRKHNAGLLIGTHTSIMGQALSDIAPMMTQVVSALTVGYATYEGVTLYFSAHWVLAIILGTAAAVAVESVGFVSVDERDKAESHNRRTPNESQHVSTTKANSYVVGSFLVTVAIVASFESIPSVMRWLAGNAELGEVLFRCGLLVFPFLSRLGANLFAFRLVREQVDRSRDDMELRGLETSLKKDEMRAKYAARVAKLAVVSTLQKDRKVSQNTGKTISFSGRSDGESFQKVSPESKSIGKQLVLYYKDNPGAKLEDAAKYTGWSVPVVSKEISALVESGVFHAVKDGRRKVVTVNGNHEEYLAS